MVLGEWNQYCEMNMRGKNYVNWVGLMALSGCLPGEGVVEGGSGPSELR
jgi:hypothetical protein